MLALSLVLIGILLRVAPHAPNFTPVAAIALFGGAYLNKKYLIAVPLVLMIASDLVIGLHNTVFFTWGGFILIALLGMKLKKKRGALRTASLSLASALLFYVVSNFGVWLMGWYPRTLKGLIDCYVLAIPFLRSFTAATLLYTAVFFGVYELIAHSVKHTKLARVLLTN